MRKIRLRTKFLLSLLVISAGLTTATLAVVSYSVQKRIRESLREDLRNSVHTYQTFEQQRELAQRRSAELLADLPTVRALMTTEDDATIQDESENIWHLSGSDLLVLADRRGRIVGLRGSAPDFHRENAQELLNASVERQADRDWWFGNGHLYEIWIQPIYFGPQTQNTMTGLLAVGHEIDSRAAHDFSGVVSSDVVFRYGSTIVAGTVPAAQQQELASSAVANTQESTGASQEMQLGAERYLVATVRLFDGTAQPVTLSVLKSFDKATLFLRRLNRVLVGLGLLSILAGGALVFLISHTFTRPLASLVSGVRALEKGDFDYPLEGRSGDEVAEVTDAFARMRTTLQNTQNEQKQLEDRLRQAHKMEAVGRLAGGVAHDFNNLLTVIRGNSDLLADREGMDNLFRRCVEQIQKASGRAVSMTRQLLAFSRMQVLQPRVLDLNTIVADMGKMLPRLIGEHIEYSFVAEPQLATVLADPGQMEQVILNLAVNARDAMPGGGKLIVRTANVVMDEIDAGKHAPMTPGKYVLLSVTDSGHGMDDKTKAHIFEPFFTTKEVGKGTGLGLATVYGIVKQSGGFIWVESAPGKGATFEIYMPRTAEPVSVVSDEGSRVASLPRGRETILVVEDESAVRELTSQFLGSSGYTVLEAKDGVEALEVATRHSGSIQIVLSDLVMPRMGGMDLAVRIKQVRPDVKIVFMTGYAEYSSKEKETSLHEANILQKPFSRQSLLEKMREVLTDATLEHAGEVRGGDFLAKR